MINLLSDFVSLLWVAFNDANFHPIYAATWELAVVLLVLSIVLYNFQGRRLRNYSVFLDLNEWLMWTTVGTFSLMLMYCVFGLDFIFVLPTMVGGAALFIWIRFIHFPPLIRAYEGPPGTRGVEATPIHGDERGVVAELALRPHASLAAHSNPNLAYLLIIEGGGFVQVGDERARVAAGDAVVWPPDVVHAVSTELTPMRAIVSTP